MRHRLLLLVAATTVVTACGGSAAALPSTGVPGSFTPATLSRPESPVKVTLVSPTNGAVIKGTTVPVVVAITGGTVTPVYSSHISPVVGHVHLYMNNQLVYMTYTLHQDLPVNPGTEYSMFAEWVAADHFPYSPRDVTPKIFFTVAAS